MRRILQVAYPLASVGPDAAGGAEQVLHHLEKGLHERGIETVVIAQEGSTAAGRLIPVPAVAPPYDERAVRAARRHHGEAIQETLARWPADLVHMHGFDFDSYLPPPGIPVLATLHCPASWYSRQALDPPRAGVWLNAVSRQQHAALLPNRHLLGHVENGVPLDTLSARHAKRRFALVLARIAPDKGIREALEAARTADIPLLVGGELYLYPEHQRYFEELQPLLDRRRRYLGPVGFARKRRLLAAAQCVIVPSLVPETSSLVAREALAAGTPVVAFRRGALIETIEHGRTGFLGDDIPAMAEAIAAAPTIDPETCRATARARFSLTAMVDGYMNLYREVIARSSSVLQRAAEPVP